MNNNIKKILLKESRKSFKKNEVPVGAVITYNNKIIAKAHNIRQKKYDVLGHAEIIAIKKASKKLKDWRLNECEMYVTLKPCSMCEQIIKKSRLNKVYFILDKSTLSTQNQKVDYKQTPDDGQYKELFQKFFKNMR